MEFRITDENSAGYPGTLTTAVPFVMTITEGNIPPVWTTPATTITIYALTTGTETREAFTDQNPGDTHTFSVVMADSSPLPLWFTNS